VRDFVVYGNDLIVATHGRGFWVMDDISALRQVSDAGAPSRRLALPVRGRHQRHPGRRRRHTAPAATEPQALNPPDGALSISI